VSCSPIDPGYVRRGQTVGGYPWASGRRETYAPALTRAFRSCSSTSCPGCGCGPGGRLMWLSLDRGKNGRPLTQMSWPCDTNSRSIHGPGVTRTTPRACRRSGICPPTSMSPKPWPARPWTHLRFARTIYFDIVNLKCTMCWPACL